MTEQSAARRTGGVTDNTSGADPCAAAEQSACEEWKNETGCVVRASVLARRASLAAPTRAQLHAYVPDVAILRREVFQSSHGLPGSKTNTEPFSARASRQSPVSAEIPGIPPAVYPFTCCAVIEVRQRFQLDQIRRFQRRRHRQFPWSQSQREHEERRPPTIIRRATNTIPSAKMGPSSIPTKPPIEAARRSPGNRVTIKKKPNSQRTRRGTRPKNAAARIARTMRLAN